MRKKLRELREQCGFTQYTISDAISEELKRTTPFRYSSSGGEKLECSRSHYSQIETGEKTPSLALAIAIACVLGYYESVKILIAIFFDRKSPNSRPCIDKNKKKRRR